MEMQNEANGTASEPIARYDELPIQTGKVMGYTNADRIRAMSDEELAKKMSGLESFALTCGSGWPPEKWLDWLREEVKE